MRKVFIFLILLSSINELISQECFSVGNIPDLKYYNWDASRADSAFFEAVKNCKGPDFKCTTLDGKFLNLSELKGKIIVMNFWFKECQPCIAEFPGLNKLVKEYDDVVFIGFARNVADEIDEDFLKKHPFDFYIVPNCAKVAADYLIHGWPTTYILDKKGRVRSVFSGGKIDEEAGNAVYSKIKPVLDSLR